MSKDKCPGCGASVKRDDKISRQYECFSWEWQIGSFNESKQCLRNQIEHLQAIVDELHAELDTIADYMEEGEGSELADESGFPMTYSYPAIGTIVKNFKQRKVNDVPKMR